MEKLIEILKEFEINRKSQKESGEWNHNTVANCFKPCAEKILCSGYFLINGKYIIDLGAIELYYHEEDGDIKDYIMYHTNEHPSKSRMYELNNNRHPYFKFGSLNMHQSGIDVTFENSDTPNDKYRASFLIRSYRLLVTQDGNYPLNDNTEYDPYSTHIFDDIFYEGISLGNIKIEWKEKNKEGEIEDSPRRRVSMYYRKNNKLEKLTKDVLDRNNMCLIFDKGLAIEGDCSEKYDKTFISSRKTYIQDPRRWQFKLKNIKEKK